MLTRDRLTLRNLALVVGGSTILAAAIGTSCLGKERARQDVVVVVPPAETVVAPANVGTAELTSGDPPQAQGATAPGQVPPPSPAQVVVQVAPTVQVVPANPGAPSAPAAQPMQMNPTAAGQAPQAGQSPQPAGQVAQSGQVAQTGQVAPAAQVPQTGQVQSGVIPVPIGNGAAGSTNNRPATTPATTATGPVTGVPAPAPSDGVPQGSAGGVTAPGPINTANLTPTPGGMFQPVPAPVGNPASPAGR